MLKKTAIIVAGAAVLLGSIAYTKAKDVKAKSQAKARIVVPSGDADKSTDKESNQYWIGVHCVAPLPEMIRAHVELPADVGIFVAQVVPQGPAAAAGIQRHDIILAAADKPLKEVADLIAAVRQSQNKKLTLKILRGGRRQDIELAPQKRPPQFDTKGPITMPPGSKWNKLGEWFEENRPGRDGRPPLRMRFMHPGMILPPKSAGTIRDKITMPDPATIEKSIQDRMQKQIDAMSRQMKKLEKLVEGLHQERMLLDESLELKSKTTKKISP